MRSLLLLLGVAFPILGSTQSVNRYYKSSDYEYVSTYIPMSFSEMAIIAYGEAMNKKKFQEYSLKAYEYLNKNNLYWFTYYALEALNTGYYNALLYYNLGIAYSVSGEKRNAKKYLKKAKRKGVNYAKSALQYIREKKTVDKRFFIIQ